MAALQAQRKNKTLRSSLQGAEQCNHFLIFDFALKQENKIDQISGNK
jgi:hypothetical protein